MRSWLRNLTRSSNGRRVPQKPRFRKLNLEGLEDRYLLSGFLQTNLVSDQPDTAQILDPQLVNAWGISLSPTAGAFWVSDNGTGVATLYTGAVNGFPLAKAPLTVTIPGGAATGQVFNNTPDFVLRNGSDSAPAVFLFASENGNITGWNPDLPPPAPSTAAQPAITIPDAVFKGLAIGNNGDGNFLYAADFHGGQIDVFDAGFHLVQLSGSFTDPKLPKGFAPFNIQNLGGQLYVTYALQDEAKHDDVPGKGNGFVDVFDTNGNFLSRLASQGTLNSPWGLALAPADFGEFSNDLLVGNFGDGHINVYDPNNGSFFGQMTDAAGKPIVIDGLWGLTFGNGVTAGDTNVLFFAAGPDKEQHGLFGSLQTVAAAPELVQTGLVSSIPGLAPQTDKDLIIHRGQAPMASHEIITTVQLAGQPLAASLATTAQRITPASEIGARMTVPGRPTTQMAVDLAFSDLNLDMLG